MASGRLFFVDRLRVLLTVLVILHHTAITYGGSGEWFYREVRDGGTPTSLLLTAFCAVNQSFFMGMFFLLAGYFTPASLARKGVRQFVGERLVRLGVPLLVFGFILGPLAVALAGMPAGGRIGERWLALLSNGTFTIGPLWFAWALLLFALAFVLWRRATPESAADQDRPLPSSLSWLIAALAVGATALVVRQFLPVGENVLGLQLGYFASYVFLFALGCKAARHRWLERVEHRQAMQWARVALLTVPMLFIAAALSGALQGKPVNFNGGFGLPAVVYALWEPLVAWGVIASLTVVFRDRFNTPNAVWQAWGTQAFGAFILHAPILVGISIALAGWAAPPALKFVFVGPVAVVASFAVAAALLKLPGSKFVLAS